MEWTQVLTILGGNTALFLWATRQARTDFLHLDKKMDENRKETSQILKGIQQEVQGIQSEMKDFHNRLIKIEEARK